MGLKDIISNTLKSSANKKPPVSQSKKKPSVTSSTKYKPSLLKTISAPLLRDYSPARDKLPKNWNKDNTSCWN